MRFRSLENDGLVPVDEHSVLRRDRIGVLIRVEDIRAVPGEDLSERRHDATPVGERDEQGSAFRMP
jgi:hypothetical protein